MNQEFLLLDNGGIMTPEKLQIHRNTVAHYNKLIAELPKLVKGSDRYNAIHNKATCLKAYIERDLQEARARADRLINTENK